jgi:hypothetical protein
VLSAVVLFDGGAHLIESRCVAGLLGTIRVPAFTAPRVTVRAGFVVDEAQLRWSSGFVPDPPPIVAAPGAVSSSTSSSCTPPYLVDVTTGKKKYRLDCLK